MRLPVLLIVFLFVFSFLIDLYIAADCGGIWKKKGRKIYWITALICYAVLIVAISLPRRDASSAISPVMWLLFTYISIYFGKLFYLLCSLVGRLVRTLFKIKSRLYPFRLVGIVFGAIFIGVIWVGAAYTGHHIVVHRQDIFSQRLPEEFNGFTIVQISDLHVGTWGDDTRFVQKLVDTVNNLHPDIIVFTGDVVNRQTNEIFPFIEVLSHLKAREGVYSILGNHDYGDYVNWPDSQARKENNRLLESIEKGMGWNLMNNETKILHKGNDSILLIGVENWGEPPFPIYGDLNKALPVYSDSLPHQNDNNFKILLSHNPEHWNREVSKNTNIDLTLSGHTHAWQILLKIGDWRWSPSKYRYEQWGGLYERENNNGETTSLYVNIGAGEVGMPARLLSAFPEVTAITLRRE